MDSNRLEKEIKKEKMEKLEKKLENRKLTIYEALQEDCIGDWLKTGHPGFITMLTPSTMIEIISYVVVPGPPDNKIRSFKLPQAATEFLSSMVPKVTELFFAECQGEKGTICLDHLLAYFNTPPNFVISSYVVKILMNLMMGNGPRVMQHIMKNKAEKMIRYAGSQSIVDFLLRIMIVQDVLLNCAVKERLQLFGNIIDIYVENKQSEDVLANLNQVLCEAITRLWTNKHKELGRYSSMLFKIIEHVIDQVLHPQNQNNLYQQENLIMIVMRHLTLYQKEAPYLVIALYKKIYNEFASSRGGETIRTQGKLQVPRFTMRKLKMLQSLHFIFSNSPDIIAKQLVSFNIFIFLLEFVQKFEWNSIVLVEVQKILKIAILSGCQGVYQGLIRSHLATKLKDMVRNSYVSCKFGHGYSGFLTNMLIFIDENFKAGLPFAQYIKKNYPETDLIATCTDYINKKEKEQGPPTNDDTYKVVHDVARPQYSFSRLSEVFKDFFEEAEVINAKLRQEKRSIVTKSSQGEEILHEIENQNELVYQLLTQNTETLEQKKSEIENANE